LQQPGLVQDVYGHEKGESIMSECGVKAYLKAGGDAASNWVASSINDFVPEWDAADDNKRPERSYPPRYFMALPEAGYDNGLYGVYLSPSVSGWEAHYEPAELSPLLPKADKNVQRFVQLESEFLKLKQWSKADSELFGIPWPLPDAPSQAKERTPQPTPPTDDDPLAEMVTVRP
jgi:hypothetical protein